MDLSFHNQQFGTVGENVSDRPLPRLSHERLMAIVNGKTSLAMLRSGEGHSPLDRPDSNSMAARRRLLSGLEHRNSDYNASARGSFQPACASARMGSNNADNERKGELSVYQRGSVIGKKPLIEFASGDDGAPPPMARTARNAHERYSIEDIDD